MFIFKNFVTRKLSMFLFVVILQVVLNFVILRGLISPSEFVVQLIDAIIKGFQDQSLTSLQNSGLLGKNIGGFLDVFSIGLWVCLNAVILASISLVFFLINLNYQVDENTLQLSEFNDKLRSYERRGSAIIPYKGDPLRAFFHARIIEFYSPDVYNGHGVGVHEKSIDILNDAEYQNLLLSPTYLEYLFNRKKKSNVSIKVVVVSIVDEGLSVYLTLCKLAGYEVYIINSAVYHHCVELIAGSLGRKSKEILNGNPYFLVNAPPCTILVTGMYEAVDRGVKKEKHVESSCVEKLWPVLEKLIAKCADGLGDIQRINRGTIDSIISSQATRHVDDFMI